MLKAQIFKSYVGNSSLPKVCIFLLNVLFCRVLKNLTFTHTLILRTIIIISAEKRPLLDNDRFCATRSARSRESTGCVDSRDLKEGYAGSVIASEMILSFVAEPKSPM